MNIAMEIYIGPKFNLWSMGENKKSASFDPLETLIPFDIYTTADLIFPSPVLSLAFGCSLWDSQLF